MSSRLKPSVLDGPSLDRAGREGGHVAEMQRRRLLLAFTTVLAEEGLEGAGVGRVCARAGVSRRTFYELFTDREACFAAVLDATVERVSQSMVAAYARGGRWRERVRAGLAVLLDFFHEDPALARVCLVETLKAGPLVMECRRRVLDVLAGVVEEGRSESKSATGPPPLTAQSTVGGAVAVIHTRVLEDNPDPEPLTGLLNPLMSMIVHPYLGPAAARRELDQHTPSPTNRNGHHPKHAPDPFKDLPIRITFRTARVLSTIALRPGSSNRQIGDTAGITDQGQISKLLTRLQSYELIENHTHTQGEPNTWTLTQRGQGVLQAIGQDNSADTHPAGNR